VGHIPAPVANGQQIQTHAVAPASRSTETVVELVELGPASVNVPGSPEPWSPAVPCHGAGPSLNVAEAADAERLTAPFATQTVWTALTDVEWPITDTEHHER
jgi:hypothetical protein